MIRKSLLIGLLFAFASLAFLVRAHAEIHETPANFWAEQYAHGALIQPRPIEVVSDAMHGASRFLTHHMDHLVRHVGRGYRRLSRSGAGITDVAARYIGTNPTGWAHNWCAEFANQVLRQQGYVTSGSAMALSFAHYGPHLARPVPGAIAVLRGHVGFVESVLENGDVVLVSGNGGRSIGRRGRVTVRSIYSRQVFVAFVMPRRST